MIAVFDYIEGFSSESMMPAPAEPTQPAISPSVSGKTSAALSTSSHAPYYTGAPSAEWETIDLSLDGGPGMPRESLLMRLGDKRKSAEDSGSTGERLPKVPRTAIRPSASSSARSETASSKLVQPVVVVSVMYYPSLDTQMVTSHRHTQRDTVALYIEFDGAYNGSSLDTQ